ncbi:hypothetical protein [uncultured Cellulomonas sp.]|uniref:hypothetical protein n=1 Tax=uncultured Cellulomonas sp. TaxID=189682 RepID=UPI0026116016|nr:hypothetical protein [uncultured Cellulomonas sp.]
MSSGEPQGQPAGAAPLVTFDCFDTVVTRAVGGPRSVGYVTAARLASAGVLTAPAEIVVSARIRAEELVHERYGEANTLTQIAVQWADLLGLDPGVAAVLERTELEVEVELTRPVPAAKAQVDAARAGGERVGFLSDTPLPHAVVADLLRRNGVLADGDPLWVSNELRAGKDKGSAYFEVARRLGGVPGPWRHVGDNQRSDVRMARLSGLTATWEGRGQLNRYEQILEDAAPATGGFSSLLAGASRRTRLVLEVEQPGMARARASVVAGVAAPLLVGYVLWSLQRAVRSGCRRVYFVARDGEVMLAIARRLVEGLGLDLDLRYLEGSRRAWLLPSMAELDAGRLAAVLGREDRVTVRNCLGWVDVDPETQADVLAGAGFPAGTWDEHLDPAALDRLIALVVGPGLGPVVAAQAQERTAATQDYLRGAGLLDGELYALVDIGWQGTVGRLLTAVLERCGGSAPAVECYFGVTYPRHDAPGRDVHGYMYDDWRGTGFSRYGHDIYIPLELFTAATHGRVEGYRTVDGHAEAVLGAPADAATGWIADVRRGIEVFCDELVPALGLLDPFVDVRTPTWRALRRFWQHPTAAEVAAWGSYPFENDVSRYPIAGHLPVEDIVRSVLQRRPRLRAKGTWPAGVWASTPAPVQVLHRGARSARGAVGKVARARSFAAGRAALRATDDNGPAAHP